jgi:hypothetical protein
MDAEHVKRFSPSLVLRTEKGRERRRYKHRYDASSSGSFFPAMPRLFLAFALSTACLISPITSFKLAISSAAESP